MKFDRITKILLGVVGAGVWALVIVLLLPHAQINKVAEAQQKVSPKKPKKWSVDQDVLTVHRLNVVNAKGQLQWVISDSSHFPPPIINGKAYDLRSIAPTGVIFYDFHGRVYDKFPLFEEYKIWLY